MSTRLMTNLKHYASDFIFLSQLLAHFTDVILVKPTPCSDSRPQISSRHAASSVSSELPVCVVWFINLQVFHLFIIIIIIIIISSERFSLSWSQ